MNATLPKAARDALRFEEKVLPNGLTLRVYPMPEHRSVHAIYTAGFGSIHRSFTSGNSQITLPAGIAHFLEHKMFENEDGKDAFSLYAETGASANAYTSFERTSYIFTATDRVDENLDILLSFVGHPHFTDATVQKEQGIIAQEIKMYADDAENRLLFSLLAGLYKNHPLRDEIVGSVESIGQITPAILYSCCDAFYRPSNMALCAAGDISLAQLESAVERAAIANGTGAPINKNFPKEPKTPAKTKHKFSMPVSLPLLGLGFKEDPALYKGASTEVVCDLITELLSGETSSLYRRLYDEGLIQADFSGEFLTVEGALSFFFTGESAQPEKLREEILREIARQRKEGIDPRQFDLCKNMMYGESVAAMESAERMASHLTSSHFKGRTPAEELQALAEVSVGDVNEALQQMLQQDTCATVLLQTQE